MSRKMNWPAHNRQERLWRWIRQHGDYSWVDSLPAPDELEIDRWAKRLVRQSLARVRKVNEKKQIQLSSPESVVNFHLLEIEVALEADNLRKAKKSGENILNLFATLSLTAISKEIRAQIVETISLLLEIE